MAPGAAIDVPVGGAEGLLQGLVWFSHALIIHALNNIDRHMARHFASRMPAHAIGNQGQQTLPRPGTGWLWISITGTVFITGPETTRVTAHADGDSV
jgi:hypothetical protein